MAFIVFESAKAMSQKSLVLPQPSWRSTFIASSSSLNTWATNINISIISDKQFNLKQNKEVRHWPVFGENVCVDASGGIGHSQYRGCHRCYTGWWLLSHHHHGCRTWAVRQWISYHTIRIIYEYLIFIVILYSWYHLFLLSIFAHPATRRQSVYVILVQYTKWS